MVLSLVELAALLVVAVLTRSCPGWPPAPPGFVTLRYVRARITRHARTVTIGDFARMTHLSVKALRHYHDVGVLEPAAGGPVPAATGSTQPARSRWPRSSGASATWGCRWRR